MKTGQFTISESAIGGISLTLWSDLGSAEIEVLDAAEGDPTSSNAYVRRRGESATFIDIRNSDDMRSVIDLIQRVLLP